MSEAEGPPTLAGRAEWLSDRNVQRLLAALSEDGEEARVAGGAIRNVLLGAAVTDIDIATTTLPEETVRRAKAAGFKPVPTGIEHGTVTVVAGGRPFEVTTLRADIETFGRHAKVAFGRDWKADAERRDFTMNALYAEADGTIVDLVGGLADIESRTLRFIGDAEARIREDYLRILRFFRFFAWYGKGRPDAEGLKACARLKDGLKQLSAERVWSELKKLLSAPDPSRALLWMRQAGVLGMVLPEGEKWGIDAIHALTKAEADLDWMPDALSRLEAIVPPDAVRMKELARRLKLSRVETDRLVKWALADPVTASTADTAFARMLYRGDARAVEDCLRLAFASARSRAADDDSALIEAGGYSRLLGLLESWKRPIFPVSGDDLCGLGLKQGKGVGELLAALESDWIDTGFTLDRDALMKRAAEKIADSGR
jgi:tRNA nucleotidyltransferase/poly(A) polymerase